MTAEQKWLDGYRTLFPPHLKLACGALAQRVAKDTATIPKRNADA